MALEDEDYHAFISLGRYTEEEVPYQLYKDLLTRFLRLAKEKVNSCKIPSANKHEVNRQLNTIQPDDLWE